MRLEARPSAKLNLALAVTGRRPDGYHELASVFVRVGLSDHLVVRPAEPPHTVDRLTVSGAVDAPLEGNIVLRAVRLLRAEAGAPLPPLELELEKRIPIAAGLGGGSADAAAALRLAAEIWGVGLSPERERALALALGADVPFFMGDHAAALVQGIGEVLEPLPAVRGGMGTLLVTPAVRLSTPEAFRSYDGLAAPESRAAETVADLATCLRDGLDGSDLVSWSERLATANDLWPAALAIEPGLSGIRTDLDDRLDRRVLMTGSGATLVGLYASGHEAAEAGQRLITALPDSLAGSSIAACDPAGPDPLWRYP